MEAVKQTRIRRRGNELLVTLPDNFTAEKVDILIWPSDETESIPSRNVDSENDLSKELLAWPIMSDDEWKNIQDKRKHLDEWK